MEKRTINWGDGASYIVDVRIISNERGSTQGETFAHRQFKLKREGITYSAKMLDTEDSNLISLEIPSTPPAIAPAVAAPALDAASDGVEKTIVRYIICGQDGLFAYTTTRQGFPGTRFWIERKRPNQQDPQYLQTSNREEANAKWNEWYREWKIKGFGGASGTGLSGEPPF